MPKYRVIVRAFTLRRDIASAELLRRLLERQGCEVILASGRDFLRRLRHWNPDAVLVNTVGQIRRCSEIVPNAAIIMWPGEGANAFKHSDPANFANRPQDFDKLSRYLTWGRGTEQYFGELFPGADPKKRVLCGNPRLDLVKFHPELLDQISSAKTIGFVGRYHIINRYNGVPAIFSMQTLDKRPRVLWQVDGFLSMVELIHRIIAETDVNISVRPHPLEAPEGYDFMREKAFAGRVEIDDSLDVAAWMARQKIIVAPSSTSFYEAYVLGIPTINLDSLTGNTELTQQMTPHAALSQEVSYNPASYEEAVSMIKSGLPAPRTNALIEEHLAEFHDWQSPCSAVQRAADATMEVLKARKPLTGWRLPSAALDIWDRVSFRRVTRRESHHTNFNYHEHYHTIPKYYDRIVENILNGRSIHGRAPKV